MNIDLPWKEDPLSLSLPETWHVGCPGDWIFPGEVIRMGEKRLDSSARVAVFPDGGATFPVI